jgi:hypothetical protein
MNDATEWDEALFRRSLADLAARRPVDGEALSQFREYWSRSLEDAEMSGAVTGVERDVLEADIAEVIRSLPGVTVVEFGSGASLRVPFTK